MDTSRAFVCGCETTHLLDDEARFIERERPYGMILFGRNIDNPDQVRTLCNDIRSVYGFDHVPILVDQEGGRVQRLGLPKWPGYPSMEELSAPSGADGESVEQRIRDVAQQIGGDLAEVGINVDCAPVADLRFEGAHDIVGDRAFAGDPEIVGIYAAAYARGLKDAAVEPVIKHVPGHGRATVDSHHGLPIVNESRQELSETDFVPFRALKNEGAFMVSHVCYAGIDDRYPASQSSILIQDVIREEIGFSGLLITDDIDMNALSGDVATRAAATIRAGCDITLYCWPRADERDAVANAVPELSGDRGKRADAFMSRLRANRE